MHQAVWQEQELPYAPVSEGGLVEPSPRCWLYHSLVRELLYGCSLHHPSMSARDWAFLDCASNCVAVLTGDSVVLSNVFGKMMMIG